MLLKNTLFLTQKCCVFLSGRQRHEYFEMSSEEHVLSFWNFGKSGREFKFQIEFI